MRIFWCGTEPWLARPALVRRFCARAGLPTGDFISHEDLVPHAAGRYLLIQGFRQYRPDAVPPPLSRTESGKPYFPGGQPAFSISHTGKIAVCAFSRMEIGVDAEEIEHIEPFMLSFLRFHPEELAYLRAFPPERQAAAFCRLWARKESLLKARGGVLADLLEQESVITPEGRWKDSLGGFFLRGLILPGSGCAAAVSAKEGGTVILTRLELPENEEELPEPCQLERW